MKKLIPAETLQSLCEGFEGECSLYVSLPDTGERFTFREDRVYNAASTIKIPLLAKLFQDAEAGRVDPEKSVQIDPINRVRGSGILKHLSPEIALSLYDYAVLMIIVSDNSATNQVIDAVGMERANEFFRENGWKNTTLGRKLFVPTAGNTAKGNYTTAAELGNMLERILARELVSADACEKMMSIMACQTLGKFSKSLPSVYRPDSTREPLGPVPEGKVILVEKGGTLLNKVSHDAAIMLLPNGKRAVLVMMTESDNNARALNVIQKVSRALYDALIDE